VPFDTPFPPESYLNVQQPAIREQLSRIGRDLFWMGLQTPFSGNLSAMLDGHRSFVITRRGSSLRMLDPERDFVTVELDGPIPEQASSEVAVHRAIYCSTGHRAVVHAHPPYAIALSFGAKVISPIHNEAQALLGDIPVTASSTREGEGEDPAPIVGVLKDRQAVMVRGHGAFCAAADCESAFYYMGLLEAACKIVYLTRFIRPE
jgi:L-fuculose-phosphate aldolase